MPRHARWLAPLAAALVALGLGTISAEGSGYFTWGALALSLVTVVLIATVWMAADAGPVGRGLAWAPLVWIGTISYGIYLWHWPVYLWLGAREPQASALRRAVAIVVTIAIAAASYHLVERPIRRGGARGSGGELQRWLARPRNVLLAMPLALGFVACASLQATTVPPVTDTTLVIMMTGDSVPKQIIPALEDATESRDWRFIDATAGGCPVTGEEPVDPNGISWTTVYDCRDSVVATQDRLLNETDPQVVLWWDRPSISNFLAADDSIVLAGSDRFWALRKQALDDSVRRLSANGAVVVLMATEPPGVNLAPSDWAQFQIEHYRDITVRWDNMLRAYAKTHAETALYVDVRPIVCPIVTAPCDDMVDGVRARHDGQHYERPGSSIPLPTIIAAARASRRDGRSDAAVNALTRTFRVAAAVALVLALLPLGERTAAATTCGVYRWPVQTLSDPARKHVASHPTLASVRTLRAKATPSGVGDTSPRQPPTETALWRIHARILKARRDANGDVRAVIVPRNDVRATMTVIFHPRRCIASAYRRTEQAQARAAVLEACGRIGSRWTDLGGLVTVTGAGFWDTSSQTNGGAPNGIELDPILGFRGSCWHTRGVFTALLAGDSVPHQLGKALEDATGWRILDATMGGCPATGEEPVDATGKSWTGDEDCRDFVVHAQHKAMAAHPDLILWWDRPSISSLLTPRGQFFRAGTTRFWQWRRDALDRAVHRLSADGATVALIATEPSGFKLSRDVPWHRYLINHYDDLTRPWNRMMARYASSHGVISTWVSITRLICHTDVSPCNDRLPSGEPARPRGQHYEGPGIPVAIDALLRRLAPTIDRLGG